MSAEKILVVDDEPQIRRFLKVALESYGYKIEEAENAKRALEIVNVHPPDLVILDLGLPDIDGLELLRSLRTWATFPVIILSAKDQEEIIICALDGGADDYLTKPFSTGELIARIKVCLRRNQKDSKGNNFFASGTLEVDLEKRLVFKNKIELKLTSTEYDLLKTLVKNAGKVMTHQQLLKEIWGPNAQEHTQYLRVYIGHLRAKVEDNPSRPKVIVTEPGVGYRLKILEMKE